MPNWAGGILTTRGQALQAKVDAGQTNLVFTKMKIGSGVLVGGQSLQDLIDLISPQQNVSISGISVAGNITTLTGVVTNTGITTGYQVRELGVFAQDPDLGEILYSITIDSAPDYLPEEGGAVAVSQEFNYHIAVSNAANISATLSTSGLVTVGMLQQHNHDGTGSNGPKITSNGLAVGAAVGNIGYTPVNKAGDTVTGAINGVTAAQFDNSTKLATTAHVQRALGNFSTWESVSGSKTFVAADMGKAFQIENATLTLPSATSVPAGSSMKLIVTGTATIAVAGSTNFVVGGTSGNVVSTWTLQQGDECTLISDGVQYWYLFGTASLKQNAQFSASLEAIGYQKLPSGLIIQWGNNAANNTSPAQTNAVTFPIAFPNALFKVFATHIGANSSTVTIIAQTPGPTLSGFSWMSNYTTGIMTCNWFAIGC